MKPQKPLSKTRCAIYTRKSTDEGLDREFNSLDAQRESAEAYIKSQTHEGWTCLPDGYDDGGYTGGNMERPALKRLLADVQAGRIDCIVVYKVDRLSRSLMDFARLVEVFDKYNVSFVSVTQQFNSTTPMGRLTLHILLSFAQFEREIVSERTRDKMAATRKKGKYAGGAPVLGYDVIDRRLVINEAEAEQVRQIFLLYLELESLIPTVQEIDRKGWRTKRRTIKNGTETGGRQFDKGRLHALLTNVTYIGQVKYDDVIYPGEHKAIVDPKVFAKVQHLLAQNNRTGGVRNKTGALLRGLLRCGPCGCAMIHTHTAKGNRMYRYYVCTNAQKRGWDGCPSKSVPAPDVENFVVDQIRTIGHDPALGAETLVQARRQVQEQIDMLETERVTLERSLINVNAEIRTLALEAVDGNHATARLADLHERFRGGEKRLSDVRSELQRLRKDLVTDNEARAALRDFDPVWETLSPREQAQALSLLVERVDYDGAAGTLSVTLRGLQTFGQENVA